MGGGLLIAYSKTTKNGFNKKENSLKFYWSKVNSFLSNEPQRDKRIQKIDPSFVSFVSLWLLNLLLSKLEN